MNCQLPGGINADTGECLFPWRATAEQGNYLATLQLHNWGVGLEDMESKGPD